MNQMGKVLKYVGCKSRMLPSAVVEGAIGAGVLFYTVRELLGGFTVINAVGAAIGAAFLMLAARSAAIALKCGVFFYEDGVAFTMPQGLCRFSKAELPYSEIIAASLKERPTPRGGPVLLIQAQSGDYTVTALPKQGMIDLYETLRNKAQKAEG